jgi:hypothetical protein
MAIGQTLSSDVVTTAVVVIAETLGLYDEKRFGPLSPKAVLFSTDMYGSLAFYAALYHFWWNAFVLTLAAILNVWLWWHHRNKGKRKRVRALLGNKAQAERARIAARQRSATRPRPALQPT